MSGSLAAGDSGTLALGPFEQLASLFVLHAASVLRVDSHAGSVQYDENFSSDPHLARQAYQTASRSGETPRL